MADENQNEEAQPKGGNKLIIILGVVIVLLLGGIGALLAMSGGDSGAESGSSEEAEVSEEELSEEEQIALPPATLPLETFIVNLQVKGSFLRVTIQLEFAEPELPPTIDLDVPKIKDAIIRLLSSRSSSELLTVDGKDKIRSEIRDGVNEVLGAEEVTQVYFTEFIIQ